MSVGHLVHVLLTVYNATEHVTQKSPGPSWKDPASRFMNVEVFLIQSASLIHLVCHCAPLATTSALSQSMTWFCSTAWSVMADLWVMLLSLAQEARLCVPAVKESTSFQCSFILRPIFLPVSQCKNWGSSCKGSFTAGTQTRASILYPTGIGSIKRWCASDDVCRVSREYSWAHSYWKQGALDAAGQA